MSTRAFLALLILGLSVPLLGFSSYLVWREAHAQRSVYEAELRKTANQIDVVLAREFSFLVTLLEAVASSPAMLHDDLEKVREQVASLHALPGMNITLRDLKGNMLVNARFEFGAPGSRFTVVRDHDARLVRDRRPVMSDVARGVTRGSPSVAAAIPVMRNGEVVYLLQANLPTSHFATLLSDFRLERDMSAFIVDSHNIFVARSRDHEETTGKLNALAARAPDAAGVLRGTSWDGEPVVGVVVNNFSTGWRVGVMAPEASLEAPVRRAFRDLALLGFGCAGLGLAMAFAFGRQISSSIQALAAAGVGVPRREFAGLGRTPLREVNEVARSLDAASHELRSSEARLRESETRLKEALYQGRAFVFDADIATDMITVTGGGAEIAGYSGTGPARISGAAIRARIHRDDYANFVGPLKQLTPAAPVLDTRFRLVDTKGENVWIGIRATAVFDDGGAILRLSGLAIDITARVRAEEAQSRLAAIVETSRDMIISVEPGGKIQTWNAGARRIFGYTAEEMVGQSLRMLVPDDVADFDRTVETMERTGSIQTETVRLAKDGRRIDVMISASSIAMPDGTRGSAAIFTDITERKRFEEQQRTLINELNHRVKNSLATIQSIAAHTFRDERHRGALATFVARLIALSEAHNVLTASNWEGASLAEVVERTVAPHQTGDGARFLCSGPSVWLDPRGALALALALHELCTNAAKYGALSNPTGTVAIQWAIELDAAEGTQLSMRWVESGGPPVVPPVSPGFGTHLVRGVLSEDLNARVDMQYEPDGFLCAFVAKLGRSGRGAEAAGR